MLCFSWLTYPVISPAAWHRHLNKEASAMTLTITNIITFISMYPIAFILYYFLKSTVKSHAKRGILFGVSCSQWLPTQERDQILETYLRQLKHYLRIFAKRRHFPQQCGRQSKGIAESQTGTISACGDCGYHLLFFRLQWWGYPGSLWKPDTGAVHKYCCSVSINATVSFVPVHHNKRQETAKIILPSLLCEIPNPILNQGRKNLNGGCWLVIFTHLTAKPRGSG